MRVPHPSTGAWICIGLIGAAIAAPATVYAAASSTVAIGNTTGTQTAKVTTNHQLLTTPIDPASVVTIANSVSAGCKTIYTPPAGKAIVVTDATYTVGTGVEGSEDYGGLFAGSGCGTIVDQWDNVKKFDSLQRVFPTGLPMASVSANNNTTPAINVFLHGYLIPVGQLPHASAATPHLKSKTTD